MRYLPALALIGLLAACGGGDKPDAPAQTSAAPISKAELQTVVDSLCLEPPAKILAVLANVGQTDAQRFGQVVAAMQRTCPDQYQALSGQLGG